MSRRTMPYHRRYHGDALQGYMVLTLEERGAYTTILDLIYDNGGPIDRNERYLAGMMDCSIRLVKSLIERLIEKRKIYVTSRGQISNHRAEKEIIASLEISAKRAESASKKAGKTIEMQKSGSKFNGSAKQMQNNRSASVLLLHRTDPVIHSHPQDDAADDAEDDDGSEKTTRNHREVAVKHLHDDSETEGLPNEISENDEQLQSDCVVIPEPYKNINNLETVAARESDRDLSYLADLLDNRKPSGRTPHPPSPAGRIPGSRH